MLASGLVGIVLSLILWANLPVTALWLIGVLLGINLISVGAAMALFRLAGAEELKQGATANSSRCRRPLPVNTSMRRARSDTCISSDMRHVSEPPLMPITERCPPNSAYACAETVH